jgi:hypothetical protein
MIPKEKVDMGRKWRWGEDVGWGEVCLRRRWARKGCVPITMGLTFKHSQGEGGLREQMGIRSRCERGRRHSSRRRCSLMKKCVLADG